MSDRNRMLEIINELDNSFINGIEDISISGYVNEGDTPTSIYNGIKYTSDLLNELVELVEKNFGRLDNIDKLYEVNNEYLNATEEIKRDIADKISLVEKDENGNYCYNFRHFSNEEALELLNELDLIQKRIQAD